VLNQQVVGQPLTVMPLPAHPNIISTESEDNFCNYYPRRRVLE
jgi:hypothetical protein